MARKKKPASGRAAQFRDVDVAVLRSIIERARTEPLGDDGVALLMSAVDTITTLTSELQLEGVTLARLRRLFLGKTSEKTADVLGGDDEKTTAQDEGGKDGEKSPAGDGAKAGSKARGHGKNGAAAYTGATRKKVTHEALNRGDKCSGCLSGKLYPMKEPTTLLRVHGMAPISATIWECDRLRCNACGEVFTAPAPDGVGTEKYDESAAAMVAMLRYGAGVPFNRIERLQDGLGVPLPASTQWGLVDRYAEALTPVFDALVQHAAQGEVLHNDDTSMTVLELGERTRAEALAAGESEVTADRTGVRTSGVVSRVGEHKVALFFTGRQLAGEALEEVLQERLARLPMPIQMSDALAHNLPPALKTIVANCLAHGRRYFVDIVERFPDECRKVLVTLGDVYKNDAVARDGGQTMMGLLQQVQALAESKEGGDALAAEREALGKALGQLQGIFGVMMPRMGESLYHVGLVANRILFALSEVLIGWQLVKHAVIAQKKLAEAGPDKAYYQGKIASAKFFARECLPTVALHKKVIESADLSLMELPEEAF